MTIISSVWVLIRGSYGGHLPAGCTKKDSRVRTLSTSCFFNQATSSESPGARGPVQHSVHSHLWRRPTGIGEVQHATA